jgi:hypothetical protein
MVDPVIIPNLMKAVAGRLIGSFENEQKVLPTAKYSRAISFLDGITVFQVE